MTSPDWRQQTVEAGAEVIAARNGPLSRATVVSDDVRDDTAAALMTALPVVLAELTRRIEAARDEDQMQRCTEEHSDENCDTEDWECHASGALTAFAGALAVVAGLGGEVGQHD